MSKFLFHKFLLQYILFLFVTCSSDCVHSSIVTICQRFHLVYVYFFFAQCTCSKSNIDLWWPKKNNNKNLLYYIHSYCLYGKKEKTVIFMVLWFGKRANGKRCSNSKNAKYWVPVPQIQVHTTCTTIVQEFKEAGGSTK